jgi:hypothetical protein
VDRPGASRRAARAPRLLPVEQRLEHPSPQALWSLRIYAIHAAKRRA